jgi:UDP-N-acetylmuramoyl-tripeptide--D-alanyl-D-alanine ligase
MSGWELGALALEAVGTDSRSLPPACLFVALRGERFDGHRFCAEAVRAGATAVMVDRKGAADCGVTGVPLLIVADTQRALGDMAAHVRREHGKPAVAVTGSNGKTTTKELTAAALSARGPVHKTQGNLNNLIGVPQTLFAWPSGAWAGVIEMGMNAPGEIARLTEITAPDVGLITNVAPAHLEGLGTVDAIGRAKGELFAGLSAKAVAVVNADDEVIQRVAAPLLGSQRRITFGRAANADVRVAEAVPSPAGLRTKLVIDGRTVTVELPLPGSHNAVNAAAAAAAAWALGLEPEAIAAALGRVVVPGGRLRVLRGLRDGSLSVIDDTYNANPGSMTAAFRTLGELAAGARRIAVLGDMFELGPTAPALHRGVGEAAGTSGVTHLFALGPNAGETAAGARANGAAAESFPSIEPLLAALDALVKPGDWLLVKGSRGMKMERVVQHLELGKPGEISPRGDGRKA